MALEMQLAVVALVKEILGAEEGATPQWLLRPGRVECGEHWGTIGRIYGSLTEGLTLPDEMPPRERRKVDAVLTRPNGPPRILEFDETQHFNAYRAGTFDHYGPVKVSFPVVAWKHRCLQKQRLEGGGFAKPKPPLFPGIGGRHRQRAFRDALCDILPPMHGFLPTLRIGDFEVAGWLFTSSSRDRMERLLETRL